MGKYVFLLLSLGLFWGCKEQKKEEAIVQEPEAFSIQSFPEIIAIDSAASSVLDNWPEYMAMQNSFAVLKRATNTEDLKLAIDDLIDNEKALATGEYPTDFDKLQIKSRQQVFRTFLLKVKGNLMDNRDVNEPMGQMINAYNAFNNQFNILSGTRLDTKLILNEE